VGSLILSAGCGTTRVPEEPVGPVVMPPATEDVVAPVEVKPVDVKPEVVVESKTYYVKAGDSIGSIAKRFKVSSKDIIKLNGITDPNKIRVNQKLKLPGSVELSAADAAPAAKSAGVKTSGKSAVKSAGAVTASGDVYVVKSGDMLGSIAVAHKTTSRAIKQLNGLTSDKLQVGQKLKLPKGSVASSSAKSSKAAKETVSPAPAADAVAAEPVVAPVEQPVAAVDAAPKSSDVLHVVELNQDLNSIAMMYGVRAEQIMTLNNLSSPDVKAGQTLKIPPQVE
jgi:LysM repeat protein